MKTMYSAVVILLMLTSIVYLSGCESNARPDPGRDSAAPFRDVNSPESLSRQLLVTFDQRAETGRMLFGSRRVYRGRNTWSASLHVRQRIASVAREYGLVELDGWPITSLNLYCAVYLWPSGNSLSQLLDALNSDDRIRFAQPVQEFRGMLAQHYNDPLFDVQYGRYRRAVEKLHAITRGENVRIGIVDSAVDTEHPDLKGQIHRIYNYVKTDTPDDKIHGTAITGVIAAAVNNREGVVGLAPRANLFIYGACLNVKAITRCTTISLAKAIEQAIEDRVDVLNFSLAGPRDPLIKALIRKAQQQSMTIVAAENINDANNNFPASMENVHTSGARNSAFFWFSRPEQLSTRAGGGYRFFYGTSIATAGFTGIAALLYSRTSAPIVNEVLARMTTGECFAPPYPAGMFFIEKLQPHNCAEDYE